ncbi:hypothetical protein J3R83DRAFT_8353 [Lanmaoa asiatica]|nr:hypothetical protein J3R83DRAFT_8353 [Lanmaoa asiatica]
MALPPLPQGEWTPNILLAHDTLCDIFHHTSRVLDQEQSDPLQLRFRLSIIEGEAIPLLLAIPHDFISPVLEEWVVSLAELFGKSAHTLSCRLETMQNQVDNNVWMPQPVKIVHTGKRGRPRKEINLEYLKEATSNGRQIKLTELARLLGLHRNTIRAYMKKYEIERKYSDISNSDLDQLVAQFKASHPESGSRYVMGHLRAQGYRLQFTRVLQSLGRVDRIGQILRTRQVKKRRKYYVKRPNALWHVDGHHKLIRWGIVIHGFIDGFCRTIVALRASNNNQSTTVLDLFQCAVAEFGMPSRVRGDRGGENIDVATYVVMKNGPHRASFMWGSSTHNSRIERLWVEVGTQFARRWRAFFTRLEHQHMLNPQIPSHLWLLHTLFLDAINEDSLSFRLDWNCHPINGPDTNNKSPQDLRFLGQTEFGIYEDDCEGVHPEIINKYYGVCGASQDRCEDRSGAGHPVDEDDSENEDPTRMTEVHITDLVNKQQQWHVHQDTVHVPSHKSPFHTAEDEATFFNMLGELITQEIIPGGLGLTPDEWELGYYPIFETIRVGRRRSRQLEVSLAEDIWYKPRRLLLIMAIDSSGFCRGASGTCECEQFCRRADGSPICWECDHGISKHPGATLTDDQPPPPSEPPPLSEPPSPQPPPPGQPPRVLPLMQAASRTSTVSGSNERILDVFKSIRGTKAHKLSDQTSGLVSSARAEVLAAFASKKGEYSKLAKGPTPANTGAGTRKVEIRDGQLKQSRAPVGKTWASTTQAMKNRGCFISHPPTATEVGIPVNAAWSFLDVDKQVRAWFPLVFSHLNKKRASSTSGRSTSGVPDWRLLTSRAGTFDIVEVVEPNGSTLNENKGRSKAGVADSHLWFVTRNSIPDDVYESWNTQPAIIGSDSEIEIFDEDSFSDTGGKQAEDIISIKGSATDSSDDMELTSSMFELNLNLRDEESGSGMAASKSKRVQVKREQLTPPRQYGKRSRALRSPLQSPPAIKKIKDASSKPIPLFL